VIAPAFHVVTETDAENLKRFTEAGGALLITPRSGVKDTSNAVVNQPLPGLLAGLCGVEVEDYDSLMPDMKNEVVWSAPGREIPNTPTSIWSDVVRPTKAQVVARFCQDYYAGKPAVTLNRYEKGLVVYAGVLGGPEFWEVLTGWLLDLSGVQPVMKSPKGVEVTERWQGDKRLLFLLNHTDKEQVVELDQAYTNVLDGAQIHAGKLCLPPREVLVLI
jgi:beta-galactosidase